MHTSWNARLLLTMFCISSFLYLGGAIKSAAQTSGSSGWPTYGGDAGGKRYSSATQINRNNVNQLKMAWVFHTGAMSLISNAHTPGAFESTPILFKDQLYLSSPYDEVYKINPTTGRLAWTYDPHIDYSRELGIVTSRGVTSWSADQGHVSETGMCNDRIFIGTLDARLIALDANTGLPCADFGANGTVDLTKNVDYRKGDNYAETSPPVVVGDVVVVGSGIADNVRVDMERGDVRGFDVRSGKLLWTWEPIPWANQQKLRTGAANTWSVIAADIEHGLIYLPVSSSSPDYYGGLRLGDDRDADSLVALDAKTGKKVWSYQIIHHNLWDYDLAAEPLLFTFRGSVPAVSISTKMGTVFVFNRLTGEPLYPITEVPVPQTDVKGEVTSPTQPQSSLPSLAPVTLDMSQPLGLTAADDAACRTLLKGRRYEGVFTPPSLQGTILFPSNVGGVNWGSTALDPTTGILYANTNRIPYIVTLVKRPIVAPGHAKPVIAAIAAALLLMLVVVSWKLGGRRGLLVSFGFGLICLIVFATSYNKIREAMQRGTGSGIGGLYVSHFGKEYGENTGAPYAMLREPIEIEGRPCSPTPWGTVSALNLNTGQSVWQAPLGTMVKGQMTGTTNVGGPIVTAGGLVFSGATKQPILSAFDSSTGTLLWTGNLPVAAQATPMTYMMNGKQYVVISAGGHVGLANGQGDSVIAFALP